MPVTLSEEEALADRIKKVLFVCTANVCRSPMAEAIFGSLAEERGLVFETESAGVAALEDARIDPKAGVALDELGIYAEGHRARSVSEEILRDADLVLVMSPWHVEELRRLSGSLPKEVHVLPDYVTGVSGSGGVPDPRGRTMAAYRASARQLLEYIERLLDRLEQRTGTP